MAYLRADSTQNRSSYLWYKMRCEGGEIDTFQTFSCVVLTIVFYVQPGVGTKGALQGGQRSAAAFHGLFFFSTLSHKPPKSLKEKNDEEEKGRNDVTFQVTERLLLLRRLRKMRKRKGSCVVCSS